METTKTPIRKKYLLPLTSLVGITAVVSLAAWTATTYLNGTFTTAEYTAVESNTTGAAGDWQVNNASPGAAMTVTYALGSSTIGPGAVATAPLAIRAGQGTTAPVAVSIAATASATVGAITGVTYELIDVGATFGCSPSSTGITVVAAGTSVNNATPTGTLITLPAATLAAGGTAKNLCLKVTADNTLVQGSTVKVVWAFTGSI